MTPSLLQAAGKAQLKPRLASSFYTGGMRGFSGASSFWSRPLARAHAVVRRFSGSEDGATAVEFAMIALPFFALIFGILELALIFILSTSLDNATATASRTIRTGQLQSGGSATAAAFKTQICNRMGWLTSQCSSNLFVDVRTYAKFNDITLSTPITNKTFNAAALTFTPGLPEDIVVVRAYYQWTLFTPLLSRAVERLNGGKTLVTSTVAFRNEPYS